MTDIPDWSAEVLAAKTPWQVAQLYRHAATYLRAYGNFPELSDALDTLFVVGQSMSIIDTKKRARQLCSAVKMNTKNGRNAAPPSKAAMINAGMHPVLAEFVSTALARAKVAAISSPNQKIRAVAVTAALGLNNPIGAPPAQHRTDMRAPRKRTIHIDSRHAYLGEIEIDEPVSPILSPQIIVDSIEAILEAQPAGQRNVREAAAIVTRELPINAVALETEYYRHTELHSRWLAAIKKKCPN
jgi:hypothetical protein